MTPPFTILEPKTAIPLVFDSPHSGTHYPEDFEFACKFEDLQKAEDKFVDELFACAPEYGASLLLANFPRSYIDVNRREDDIDPVILAESWPFGKINPSSRSDAGIGLIRRLVRPGIPVYDQPLSVEDITRRIEKYYKPYHGALEKLIQDAHYNFGQVWHVNCHSMPGASARPKQPSSLMGRLPRESDFVLGDRDGTSCDLDFTHAMRDFLKGLGYTVTINDPFKGVELVHRYSAPARGLHSLQIEINKSLYMNENTNKKTADFENLRLDIESFVAFCADYVQSNLMDVAAD
ncbi:MAG: N-formylglutamate amidohydrolase [Alphaproteobacteria bacterium]